MTLPTLGPAPGIMNTSDSTESLTTLCNAAQDVQPAATAAPVAPVAAPPPPSPAVVSDASSDKSAKRRGLRFANPAAPPPRGRAFAHAKTSIFATRGARA